MSQSNGMPVTTDDSQDATQEPQERVWVCRLALTPNITNDYGLLVTEGAEPDSAPVAFVAVDEGVGGKGGGKAAYAASQIAYDPSMAAVSLGVPVVDLR